MKRHILIGALLAALVMGTGYSAHADMNRGAGHKVNAEHGEHWAAMAQALGLTDAQKEQIKTIVTAEKEKNAPLIQKLKENRKQIEEATHFATFDEAAVRSLAENQGKLKADLIVSSARVHSQIQALLTPEQRVQAEKLKPLMKGWRGDGRGSCGEK